MKNDVPFWLAGLVIAIVLAVLPLPPWMIDQFYSRQAYPVIQYVVTSISNLVPLAVLDLLVVLLGFLLIRWLLRLGSVAKKDGVVDAIWDVTRRVIRAASIVAILFLLMWGLNYRRIPLEDSLKPSALPPSADELQSAVLDANALASRVRPTVAASAEPRYEDIVRRLGGPFNDALRQLNRTPLEVTGRPKYSLILTPYFTAAGIDGMINPLALESIVHPDLLPFERPFVLAHEWSHLAGAADEAEASAIGWLACMRGDAALNYSASLYLINEAGSALPRSRWQSLAVRLDPAVRGDLDAIAKRVQRQQPAVQRTASRVYDSYLKANRVDDGVASYSRALTLILSQAFHDAVAQAHPPHTP
jgi:hypothetical protein